MTWFDWSDRYERRELKLLREILDELKIIVANLVEPSYFAIIQVAAVAAGKGAFMPTDMTIVAGTSGVFVAVPQPPGSKVLPTQPVPTWQAGDSNASLAPSADGLSVTVSIPVDDPSTDFTLTVTYTRSDGTAATGTATVKVVQPVAGEPTSFTIEQTS